MRRKIKGFKIRRPILQISRWIHRKNGIDRTGYNRLNLTQTGFKLPITKLKNWGQRLTQGLRLFGSGYKPDPVPRGHLAVYVGQKDGEFHRVFVPIVYFNHPLFVELLKESEKEYGYCHQGGITIPCLYSDFERVKTRIASGSGSRRFPWSCLSRN
ncbi:unnamed protein product [Cochlearia groenlandica]